MSEPPTAGAAGSQALVFRSPLPSDEEQVSKAQSELARDGFDFSLRPPGQGWDDYLTGLERERHGVDLRPGRVPATMLFAVEGDRIVGRVSIRHALSAHLLEVGGHIGYAVRPQYRRRGYATMLLRHGLDVLRGLGLDRALVTCDEDNAGSVRVIERCGGVLENTVRRDVGSATRRYWIDLAPARRTPVHSDG